MKAYPNIVDVGRLSQFIDFAQNCHDPENYNFIHSRAVRQRREDGTAVTVTGRDWNEFNELNRQDE